MNAKKIISSLIVSKDCLEDFSKNTKILRILLLLFFLTSIFNYGYGGIFKALKYQSKDFEAYYLSGKSLVKGENLYKEKELAYPPIGLAIFIPLSLVGLSEARVLWLIINQFCLFGIILFLLKVCRKEGSPFENIFLISLVLNFYPLLKTIRILQVNLLVLFLMVFSLYLFKRKNDIFAGFLLALATIIKPFPLILIFFFLWKKEYRTFLAFLLSLLGLILISIALFGRETHMYYFTRVLPPFIHGTFVWMRWPQNQSFNGFYGRLLSTETAIWARNITSFVIIGLSFLFSSGGIKRENYRFMFEFALFIIATLLISNVTWEHHLVLLLFPFILLFVYLINSEKHGNITLLAIISYLSIGLFIPYDFPYNDLRGIWKTIWPFVVSIKLYGMLLLYFIFSYLLWNWKKEKSPL